MIMNKKIVFAITIVAVLILIMWFFVWYNFFDVTGLEFYEDQPIKCFFSTNNRVFLLTEEGYGYVAGDYSNGSSRKYLNSETTYNSYLNGSCPVKFFNGKIKQIIDEESNTFFISETDQLFRLHYDLTLESVADNVVYASAGDEVEIYFVDIYENLYVKSNEKINFLKENIKKIKCYKDFVYVLTTKGSLYLCERNDENLKFDDMLFEAVQDFDVVDTSARIIDGKYVSNDATAVSLPLVNVLTQGGDLYVKGAYNTLPCGQITSQAPAEPKIYEDWLHIASDIKQFSVAPMGTIMLDEDNKALYYGFDSNLTSKAIFGKREFDISNCEIVGAMEMCIFVKDNNGTFHIFGDKFGFPFAYTDNNDHSIMNGIAFQLMTKDEVS